jgi:hypothetical protein
MLLVDVPWIIPAALYASYFNTLVHILYCFIPAKTMLFRLMTRLTTLMLSLPMMCTCGHFGGTH